MAPPVKSNLQGRPVIGQEDFQRRNGESPLQLIFMREPDGWLIGFCFDTGDACELRIGPL